MAAAVVSSDTTTADVLSAQPAAHADLRWLVPEDQGAQIRIEEVRALIDFVWTTASAGGRKVAVVMPAERMNVYAGNALLKTLEEPPGQCALLLVSDRPRLLSQTLRSRCQRLAFGNCPSDLARAWLQGRVPEADSEAVLWLAGGAPLRALEIASSGAHREVLDALVALAGVRQSAGSVAFLERARRTDLRLLLGAWQRWLHDVDCGRNTPLPAMALPPAGTPPLAAAHATFQDELRWAVRLLSGTSNPAPQSLLESLLDSWLAQTRRT